MKPFNDMVALVTGSSDGIGRAVALEFARQGASVAVHCSGANKDSLRRGEEVANDIRLIQRTIYSESQVCLYAAQFANALSKNTTPRQIQEMLKQIERDFGRLDILILNGADSTGRESLKKALLPGRIDYNFSINFQNGLCGVLGASLKMLEQSSGTVVTISSVVTEQPEPEAYMYMACKNLVEDFTTSLGDEMLRRGINIKCLRLGLVKTKPLEYFKANFPVLAVLIEKHPYFEVAPEEVADQIVQYCDPRTRWWTHGQVYDLTRGLSGLNMAAEFEKMPQNKTSQD